MRLSTHDTLTSPQTLSNTSYSSREGDKKCRLFSWHKRHYALRDERRADRIHCEAFEQLLKVQILETLFWLLCPSWRNLALIPGAKDEPVLQASSTPEYDVGSVASAHTLSAGSPSIHSEGSLRGRQKMRFGHFISSVNKRVQCRHSPL